MGADHRLSGLGIDLGPGSFIALSCYVIAVKHLPTSTVVTYAFVNPLVAVALGGWLLDEHLNISTLVGARS